MHDTPVKHCGDSGAGVQGSHICGKVPERMQAARPKSDIFLWIMWIRLTSFYQFVIFPIYPFFFFYRSLKSHYSHKFKNKKNNSLLCVVGDVCRWPHWNSGGSRNAIKALAERVQWFHARQEGWTEGTRLPPPAPCFAQWTAQSAP